MAQTSSELRVPADPAFILVAKRAAAGFASVAGFDVEGVDDVVIAVAQACQNAISCCRRAGGEDAELRLLFTLEDHRLEVQVRSVIGAAGSRRRAVGETAVASLPAADVLAARARRSAAAVEAAEQEQRAAEHLRAAGRSRARAEAEVATELALRVMGLFVDDYRYRLDERTGGLRVRLTKYRGR